jgi:hypothetical protein
VNDAHEEGELLQRGCRRGGAVDDGPCEVHEGMDEEGSEVFDNEHGAPGDLGTCEVCQ